MTRRRQLSKLVEELKQQSAISAKSQTNVKELLKQRSQLLEFKKQLESQLAAGGQAVEKADQRLILLEQERSSLETALTELQQEFDDTVLAHESRIEELKAELAEGTERENSLAQELTQEQLKLSQQTTRAQELESELNRELRDRDDQILTLNQQLVDLGAELERVLEEHLEKQRDAAQREEALELALNELEQEQAALSSRLRAANQNEEALKLQLAELGQSIETMRGHQIALSQELRGEREQGVTLMEELGSRKVRGEELLEQTLQLQAQIDALESELRAREQEASYQIGQRVALEETLRLNSERHGETNAALERAQRECLSLREFVEKLQKASRDRLEQAKGALTTREGQIRKLQEALTQKARQAAIAEAKVERKQLAENALRGALIDLRQMLSAKEEMVSELEWHLGLVYQTLEDGQIELEQVKAARSAAEAELEQSKAERQNLAATVDATVSEKAQLSQEVESLQATVRESTAELANERRQLTHTLDKLERAVSRLDRVQADLDEEQERSARLGAQLTDALEDRNRGVIRLRELQEEFQSWRDAQLEKGDDALLAPRQADSEALALSQAREHALRQELESLKGAADELRASRAEALAALAAREQSEQFEPQAQRLQEQLLYGFDLGAELVAAQLEYLAAEEHKNTVLMEVQRCDDLETLAGIEDELGQAEETLAARQTEFETLEDQWNAFQGELDEAAQHLLQKFTGLIEYEMREARHAADNVEELTRELATVQSAQIDKLESLERQLEEKNLLTSELEDELAQQASLAAELAEQLAIAGDPKGVEGDEEVEALKTRLAEFTLRQDQYRQRIAELLGMLAERQQKLDQLEAGAVAPETLVTVTESLDAKSARLDELLEQQAEDKSNLAAKRAEMVALGSDAPAEARERLQLEVVALINSLAAREDEINALEDDLDSAANQPTLEDLPAVPAVRPAELE